MRLVVAAALVIGISPAASAQPADPTAPATAPTPTAPAPTAMQPAAPAPIAVQPTAPAPTAVQPTAPAPAPIGPQGPQGVMANRWAIDVGLGLQSLKTNDDNIGFVTYEIGVRLRIIRSLELALTIAAGANHADSFGGLWADVRYNFMAERRWNVFAYFGLGVASASAKDADSNDSAGRGALRFGAGVERRFDVFSISAELRVLGLGANNQSSPIDTSPESELAAESASGIGLVIGSTYYF